MDTVSKDRLRGLRIFDITDIHHPKNVGNVQTCRGSHTHSVLIDPQDSANVYVYISGTSAVRSPSELPGCLDAPASDSNTALFRIEVIKVPLAHPEQAAIVSSPRIFAGLVAPPSHGDTPADTRGRRERRSRPRKRGASSSSRSTARRRCCRRTLVDRLFGRSRRSPANTGTPTAADSATLREALPQITMTTSAVSTDRPPGRRSATTSRCSPRSGWPAARARATGS